MAHISEGCILLPHPHCDRLYLYLPHQGKSLWTSSTLPDMINAMFFPRGGWLPRNILGVKTMKWNLLKTPGMSEWVLTVLYSLKQSLALVPAAWCTSIYHVCVCITAPGHLHESSDMHVAQEVGRNVTAHKAISIGAGEMWSQGA